MQRGGFQAQFPEGVPQGLLGQRELCELTGERLRERAHVLVAPSIVPQQLQLRLQVQVHGPGPSAQPLRQSLPGGLWGADAGGSHLRGGVHPDASGALMLAAPRP